MSNDAEATIAAELMKFAMSDQLYRGSKPVMWSVVEKTALAEAEVEYQDYTSDTVWVKFPVTSGPRTLRGASIVIWTTTPWTIPGNRAVAYSPKIAYGLYQVDGRAGGQLGEGRRPLRARRQPGRGRDAAGAGGELRAPGVGRAGGFRDARLAHPLKHAGLGGYQFDVPLLPGEHVTEDDRHRLRPHRARPWPRGLRALDGASPRA